MRAPFEKLMQWVTELPAEDWTLMFGELSKRWDEPVERIMDAIDALKVMRGELTYISVPPPAEVE